MKKGGKRALRVLDSAKEAADWLGEKGYDPFDPNINIVKRPGTCKKCLQYCSVSKFCKFSKKGK